LGWSPRGKNFELAAAEGAGTGLMTQPTANTDKKYFRL